VGTQLYGANVTSFIYTLKNAPPSAYFVNNSAKKNEPILTMFGAQNPE